MGRREDIILPAKYFQKKKKKKKKLESQGESMTESIPANLSARAFN